MCNEYCNNIKYNKKNVFLKNIYLLKIVQIYIEFSKITYASIGKKGQTMTDLTKTVQFIKGVGPAKAVLLNKLRNLYTRRLNYIFPKRI